MMRANGKRTGYQDGGEVEPEWTQLAGGPPIRGRQPEWSQLAGGPPTRGNPEYTQLAGGAPQRSGGWPVHPDTALNPNRYPSGSGGRRGHSERGGSEEDPYLIPEQYSKFGTLKKAARYKVPGQPTILLPTLAKGGPVEPREEDTVYDSTAPDWTPEAYSASLRKAEMEEREPVGYQAGGEVNAPQQERSPLGQVLDYTRKQFGLDQIGRQPAARTGYQEGGVVTDDDAAERLRAQQEQEALDRAQAIARQSDDTAIPSTARATEGTVPPDVPTTERTGLFRKIPTPDQTGYTRSPLGEEIRAAAQTGREALREPPPPDQPLTAESGIVPLLGGAARKAFETSPAVPWVTQAARGVVGAGQAVAGAYGSTKEALAAYVRGERGHPDEHIKAWYADQAKNNPGGTHNDDTQSVFNGFMARDDFDGASRLVQSLRKPYADLRAIGQAAIDSGDLAAAQKAFEHAHNLLPNDTEMKGAVASNGNVTLAVTGKDGQVQSVEMTPEQFGHLLKGPGSDFDHVADNGLLANTRIATAAHGLAGTGAGPTVAPQTGYGTLGPRVDWRDERPVPSKIRGEKPVDRGFLTSRGGYGDRVGGNPLNLADPTRRAEGVNRYRAEDRAVRASGTADYFIPAIRYQPGEGGFGGGAPTPTAPGSGMPPAAQAFLKYPYASQAAERKEYQGVLERQIAQEMLERGKPWQKQAAQDFLEKGTPWATQVRKEDLPPEPPATPAQRARTEAQTMYPSQQEQRKAYEQKRLREGEQDVLKREEIERRETPEERLRRETIVKGDLEEQRTRRAQIRADALADNNWLTNATRRANARDANALHGIASERRAAADMGRTFQPTPEQQAVIDRSLADVPFDIAPRRGGAAATTTAAPMTPVAPSGPANRAWGNEGGVLSPKGTRNPGHHWTNERGGGWVPD